MHWTGYLITILLAGFTGWFTTFLAIKMLFHPRKPIKIFGLTIQGVFPKNQHIIAQKLGQIVGKELLSFAEIEQKVTDPENLSKLRPDIEAHIDNFLRNKLKDVFPMLSMFIGDKTITQMKEAFLLELEGLFPILMKNYMNKLQHDLDLERIVTEKVAQFSSDRLEYILFEITKREFKFLEVISTIMGLFIGIIQVVITILST
ncbi:MAG: DUF445 domain-containing protein [Ferruginibacter sp.]